MHRACQLGAEAAEALAHAAQMGIVHRDIKPQNLMLTRSGRCKLTDFGLARIDDPADGFSMPVGAVGTPTYMAPEVIRREPATPKSDVYSLGCVLVYLLTGKPPFSAPDREKLLKAHLESAAPNVCTLRPDLPESLGKVISRALAKEPEERPTADMLAKQLRAHTIPIGSGSVVTPASTSPFVTPMPLSAAAPAEDAPRKTPFPVWRARRNCGGAGMHRGRGGHHRPQQGPTRGGRTSDRGAGGSGSRCSCFRFCCHSWGSKTCANCGNARAVSGACSGVVNAVRCSRRSAERTRS